MIVRTRRHFLFGLISFPVIGKCIFSPLAPSLLNQADQELVIVRGWILKKSDLLDTHPHDHRPE